MNQLLWIGGALTGLALLFLLLLGGVRRRMGLPAGKQIYDDLSPYAKAPKVLYSERYHLSGKPDAIFIEEGKPVPVEIKRAKAPRQPYPGHVVQLMAYCLLIEELYSRKPAYGVLRYHDKEFKISYTIERRTYIIDLIQSMWTDLDTVSTHKEEIHRSHCRPRRCSVCGYRNVCDEKIEAE